MDMLDVFANDAESGESELTIGLTAQEQSSDLGCTTGGSRDDNLIYPTHIDLNDRVFFR